MGSVARNLRYIALGAAIATQVANVSQAQTNAPAPFRVIINGADAGGATSVANLPMDALVLQQHTDSTIARTQVVAGAQSTVIVMTNDAGLVAALKSWVDANNSGSKNTVQRKTVEISRADGPANARVRLLDAWPSKIEPGTASTAITIVYQRLDSAS